MAAPKAKPVAAAGAWDVDVTFACPVEPKENEGFVVESCAGVEVEPNANDGACFISLGVSDAAGVFVLEPKEKGALVDESCAVVGAGVEDAPNANDWRCSVSFPSFDAVVPAAPNENDGTASFCSSGFADADAFASSELAASPPAPKENEGAMVSFFSAGFEAPVLPNENVGTLS